MQIKLLWLIVTVQLLIDSRISSAESDELCGTTLFTESSGVINSSSFISWSSFNSTCNYRIEVGEDNSISLRFLYFDLPTYLDFCNRDWLRIGCLSDDSSEEFTRRSPLLCGQTKWTTELKLTECSVLSLEFVFDYRLILDRKGFRVQYEITTPTVKSNNAGDESNDDDEDKIPEIECGDTLFTSEAGVITLPNNPNIIRSKINCTYTISTNDSDTLMSSLTLYVSHLDLLTLTNDLDECAQDRLQIRCIDEHEPHNEPSRCQNFASESLASLKYYRCLRLEIILKSNDFDPRETRQIPYHTTLGNIDDGGDAICGNTVYRNTSGFIVSPRFPLPHPQSLNCSYRIIVGRENVLSLKFLSFELEGSFGGSCSYDWITMSCVSRGVPTPSYLSLTRYCGRIDWRPSFRYFNCSFVIVQFRTDSSVELGGFKIQYSVTPKGLWNITDIPCGQTEFNASDGVIALPVNPTVYPGRANCRYRVYGNTNGTFSLNMTSINVTKLRQQLGGCAQITCEGARTWNISSCQPYDIYNWNQILTFFQCWKLQISFNSDSFELREVYRIPFTVMESGSICGQTSHSGSNGNISFPHLVTSYPPMTKCNYTIVGGENTAISISFFRSTYRYPDHSNCNERITMICLQSPTFNPYSNKRFCSQSYWPPVIRFFNCSSLLVAFDSGYSYSTYNTIGFKLNYSVSRGEEANYSIPEVSCPSWGTHYSSSGGFSLPTTGLPLAAINCVGKINSTTIGRGRLSVHFQHSGIAVGLQRDCLMANLTIACVSDYENAEINSTKSLTFCGGGIPRGETFYNFSGCDFFQVSFRSSAYTNQDYSYLTYRLQNTDCGETSFSGSSGNVTSPDFPRPYPKLLGCVYNIEAGANRITALRFLTFELSGSNTDSWVRYDYYGYGDDASFGNDHFRSSYSSYDSCYSDWLIIRCLVNGNIIYSSDNQYLNRQLCGSRKTTVTLYGCQTVRLEFTSGHYARSLRGFNIQYEIENTDSQGANCGSTSFSEPSGIIMSPGFPKNYPNRLNCTYVITAAGRSKSVMLEVLSLDLQHGTHIDGREYFRTLDYCERDWLKIVCTPQEAAVMSRLENRKFCGQQKPFTVLLRGCENVFIQFVSDSRVSAQGFKIQYTVLPEGEECGIRNFSTNSTGVITSPAFPSPYPHHANCTYYIQYGTGDSVSLKVLSFNVGRQVYSYSYGSINCASDWIQVTCLYPDSNETVLASQYANRRLCGQYSFSSVILKRCNIVALQFFSNGTYSKPGFQLQYNISSTVGECGNLVYSNATGIIASPGYPANYKHLLDCTYTIEIGTNKSLLLQFLAFEVGYYYYYYYTCSSDWLKISCLDPDTDFSISANEYLNRTLCGSRSPFSTIINGCNRASIQFVTGETYSKRGFQIHYVISKTRYCGYLQPIFSDPIGVIASPDLTMLLRQPNISCTYFISAQQISTISLIISITQKVPTNNSNWLSIGCLQDGEFLKYPLKIPENKYRLDEAVFPSCSLVQLDYNSIPYYETLFAIRYSIKSREEVCGKSSFTEPSGDISFPKYSPNYATKFNCSYSIFAGDYNTISLVLWSFTNRVVDNEPCPDDWIAISCRDGKTTDSKKITHNKCSQSEEKTRISLKDCKTLEVIFHSENIDTGRLFNLSYALQSEHGSLAASQTGDFVGSKSFGVLIAFIVLLIAVSLVVLGFVWFRRRRSERKEDERSLATEDPEPENPDSQSTSLPGIRLLSFFPFLSRKKREVSPGSMRYVPMESISQEQMNASNEEIIFQ